MSDGTLPPPHLSRMARELYADGPWMIRRMQWYRPYICPLGALIAQVPSGSTVLDVGCGGGLFLALLHRSGKLQRGIGFDSSAPAIEIANCMITAGGAEAQRALCIEHRAMEDPWPTELFDVVSLIDVMHHVPQTARLDLLQRLVACTRPGGRLIYKDMCRRPLWRAWANRLHDLALARQWIHYIPVELVESTLIDMGLQLVASEDINMLWYGHELRVFRKP